VDHLLWIFSDQFDAVRGEEELLLESDDVATNVNLDIIMLVCKVNGFRKLIEVEMIGLAAVIVATDVDIVIGSNNDGEQAYRQ
jgi:hypothetical protein